MSRRPSYVYVSRNRVEKPVFRGKTTMADAYRRRHEVMQELNPIAPPPSREPPATPPKYINAAITHATPRSLSSEFTPPTLPSPDNLSGSPDSDYQLEHPSPPQSLPSVIPMNKPASPPLASPEINLTYYSSADSYSHGRLPLVPPWAKVADPSETPTPPPLEGVEPSSPSFLSSSSHTFTSSAAADTPQLKSQSENGHSNSTQPRRRNTLKKRPKRWFSFDGRPIGLDRQEVAPTS